MIEYSVIQELATKYRTNEQNIAREYCQHLFLSYLYKLDLPEVEQLLFKGGTALKIIYESPRFSEDIDFSGFQTDKRKVEDIFITVLSEIEKGGIKTELNEAKETRRGYIGKAFFKFLDFNLEAMIQVQFKDESGIKGEVKQIASDLLPPYNILMLPEKLLVNEKMTAAIARFKPRDFYDVYFMLRKGLLKASDRDLLKDVLNKLKKTNINFTQELSVFLPKDQQLIIKEFKKILESEINKYI